MKISAKFLKVFLLGLGVFAFIGATAFAAAKIDIKPTGYVNDFAGVLSAGVKANLEQELTDFDKTDSTQIAVATVNSLGGSYLEEYANALFRYWGIGQVKKNNGVLLLVSLDENDRGIRIEVGYGLEGVLTDLISGQIVDNIMIPKFKDGDFDGGVRDGVEAIIQVTRGEFKGTGSVGSSSFGSAVTDLLGGGAGLIFLNIFFVILFNIVSVFKSAALSKAAWPGAAVGGFLATLWSITMLPGWINWLIYLGVCAGIGYIIDFALSKPKFLDNWREKIKKDQEEKKKNKKKGGGGGFWFFGGGSGGSGGGFGGGGFGGFSGGSSGGGGASGRF